tara:strand:+ start:1579 stop:1875 length:297 start_codon:yes stop_codon:yes gene_type:complete
MNKTMKKIRRFFKVESNARLFLIFVIFSITGSLSVVVADILFSKWFNFTDHNFIYWCLRIIAIFPIYQILLIFVGAIFGEFKYFWEIEKRILRRFGVK